MDAQTQCLEDETDISCVHFTECDISEMSNESSDTFEPNSFKSSFKKGLQCSNESNSNDQTSSKKAVESTFFKGEWNVEGIIVHFRKVSQKIVFFDLQLCAKHREGSCKEEDDGKTVQNHYLSLKDDEFIAIECNEISKGFKIRLENQTSKNQRVKIETVLKFPLCQNVKSNASNIRLGNQVKLTCKYAEQLIDDNRSHLLFHASKIDLVSKRTDLPDLLIQRPQFLRKAENLKSKTETAPIDGLISVDKVCKYWINKNLCVYGDGCPYLHPDDRFFESIRQAWISNRIERRRLHLKSTDDPLDPHLKKNKHARAKVFSDWLVKTFTAQLLSSRNGVLDVAGGRGSLSFALHASHGVKSTLVDPRLQKLSRMEHKSLKNGQETIPAHLRLWFDHTDEACDLLCSEAACLVGLHPDEATESIVRAAVKHRTSFAVVPCCVFPTKFQDRRITEGGVTKAVDSYDDFVYYLRGICVENGGESEIDWLNFDGRNLVIFCRNYLT